MYYSYFTSNLGEIEVVASDKEIISIGFFKEKKLENPNDLTNKCIDQLKEYFSKKRTSFDLPLKLSGTSFQVDVLKELLKIPYGKTISYGQIAINIKRPKAVRAVGGAVGRNPFLIVAPCHRVVGKTNKITGFSAGLDNKRKLLNLEEITGIKD